MARYDDPVPMSPERIAEAQANNKPHRGCWCEQCGREHIDYLTPGELAWLLDLAGFIAPLQLAAAGIDPSTATPT